MAQISLLQQARDLEVRITAILATFDLESLPVTEREFVAQLKRLATDARLDVRDYEYADTRVDQEVQRANAHKRYETLQQDIVRASEYNMFSAIDVAALSAYIQQLISQME